jgi:hypothetical protein
MKPWSWDIWRDGVVPINTGCATLQLAAYLGFTEIFILGMDYAADRAAKRGAVYWKEEKHFDGTQTSPGLKTQPQWLREVSNYLKDFHIRLFFVGSPNNGSDDFPHLTFEEMLEYA